MSAVSLLDGGAAAVKMTSEGAQLDDAQCKRLLLEAHVARLVAAECPTALRFHGSWIESMEFRNETFYRFFMRLELCGSSLAALKQGGHAFTEGELVAILRQVRCAYLVLEYCCTLRRNFPIALAPTAENRSRLQP